MLLLVLVLELFLAIDFLQTLQQQWYSTNRAAGLGLLMTPDRIPPVVVVVVVDVVVATGLASCVRMRGGRMSLAKTLTMLKMVRYWNICMLNQFSGNVTEC